MSIHLLLPAIAIASNTALLGVLFARSVRLPGRLSFAAFLVTLIAWSSAQLGMGLASSADVAGFWHQVLILSTLIYVPLYLHFTHRYTGRPVNRAFFAFVVAAVSVGAVLSLGGVLLEEIQHAPVGYAPRMSAWFLLVVPALYIGGVVGLRNLCLTMTGSPSPTVRNRARYLVVASIATLALGAVDIVSAMGLSFVYVSNGGNLLFAIFATIALLNDRVVDLRKVVRRELGHLVMVPIVGGSTVAVLMIADLVVDDIQLGAVAIALTAVTVYATVSPLLHERAHRWVDSLWYGKRARSLRTLEDFAAQADSVHDMQLLGATMVYIVREAAEATHVTMLERVPGRSSLQTAASVGSTTEIEIAFPDDGALAHELRKADGALPMVELKESAAWLSIPADQRDAIEAANVALIVPIVFNDSVAGALVIGPRTDGRPYPQEETELLENIARQVSAAIENARLYEELYAQIKELKETQAQLVQAGRLATLGTLASGVAHEISNPLFSILGRIELLRRDADEHLRSDRAIEYIDSVHEMSIRISDIVKALLTFSRRDSARGTVDVHRLINDTVGLVERDLALSRINVERRFAKGQLHTVGNAAKLKQALMNVVLNAKDAMPSGGTLTIATAIHQGEVTITCEDTGRGIPKEHLSRVFDAFFTTKDRGLGAGLGLYICHSIVDEHNGHIAIESNGRQGTTVTIALPEELKLSETEAGSEPRGFQVVGAPVIKIHSYQSGGDNR